MKVFLSWSGVRSRQVAQALRDWLPGVLQSVEPWLSSPRHPAWPVSGAVEFSPRSAADVDVGILCLTSENLKSPWLMMEAGALSQVARSAAVVPYLLDVAPSDLPAPVARYRSVQANRAETLRLVELLNAKTKAGSINPQRVQEAFEVWWPKLQAQLSTLQAAKEELPPSGKSFRRQG